MILARSLYDRLYILTAEKDVFLYFVSTVFLHLVDDIFRLLIKNYLDRSA